MAVDDTRLTARRELEGIGLSVGTASYLLDDRPPGGWDSLVTKDLLRAEMAELRAEIRADMRDQTRWMATAIIGAMSVSVAATVVIGAALRFA